MKWNTEQYARLFKAIARKFWKEPLRATPASTSPWTEELGLWFKYLEEEAGIKKSDRTWDELCRDQKDTEITVINRAATLSDACSWSNPPLLTLFMASFPRKFLIAGQNEKNILVTDSSSKPEYMELEEWTMISSDDENPITDPATIRQHLRCSRDILIIPRQTAENILVLGLP